jgi:hypothetical protein
MGIISSFQFGTILMGLLFVQVKSSSKVMRVENIGIFMKKPLLE